MVDAQERRGRPTRAGERSTAALGVRLTREERAAIDAAARALGVAASEYMRRAALAGAARTAPEPPEK